jgi:hypothetical protein
MKYHLHKQVYFNKISFIGKKYFHPPSYFLKPIIYISINLIMLLSFELSFEHTRIQLAIAIL